MGYEHFHVWKGNPLMVGLYSRTDIQTTVFVVVGFAKTAV
jgi:hypothetical protein